MTCLTSVSKPLLADHAHTAIKVIPITTGGVSEEYLSKQKKPHLLYLKNRLSKKPNI